MLSSAITLPSFVLRFISVLVVLALLLNGSVPISIAQGVSVSTFAPNLIDAVSNSSAEPGAAAGTCLTEAVSGKVTADNSIANWGTEGCLITAAFPDVVVRVYNKHGVWKEITETYNLNDVVITPMNLWAQFGFIAPNAYAEYSLRFDSNYDSRVQFFVNAARSEDGYARAGRINLFFEIVGVFGVYADALDLATLEYISDALTQQTSVILAADALASNDIPRFFEEFPGIFTDDDFYSLVQYVAGKVGKTVTKDLFKSVFTAVKIVFVAKDIVETIWLIATGTFAGTTIFTSKLTNQPLPPSPGNPPIDPPLPDPLQDNSRFTGAESPNDAYIAQPGDTFRKMWQMKNTGTATWGSGYQLVFVSGRQMGAPDAVSVPAAAPQQTVNLEVDVVTPSESGTHRGYWQLRNPQGTFFGDRVWVQVTVPGQAQPEPGGGPTALTCLNCLATMAPGQSYRPTLRATIGDGQLLPSRGDMLRNKDGSLYGAYPLLAVDRVVNAGQSIDLTFYEKNPLRAPDAPGVYESKWGIWREGAWYGPELTIRFEVTASGGGSRSPNPPTLTSPHDWAVYTGNGGIVLTAQHNGDPDGDAIAGYYFELSGQQSMNSGWIGSNSWSPQGLGYYGYQWRVKVRDSRGVESGWSAQTWNFSVQTNEPQIYEFYATQCRPAWDNGSTEKICFCARTNAGTIRVQANSATDGSDRGEWEIINELGTTNYNCNNDNDRPPTWEQLRFEAGRHLVRLYARRDGGWAAAASRDIYVDLSAERRPNSPSVTIPQWESFVNSRTVLFDWRDSLRTSSYRLQVATDVELSNLLIDQTFPVGVSQYQHTFAADHPYLYGRVTASGPYGSNTADIRFKIDRTPPESAVGALPSVTFDTKFRIEWSGADSQSGLNWYHIQVRDGNRPDAEWVDWLVNTTKTAEIFSGMSGHTYYFRVRAMDKIGNWESWPPDDGDTNTVVDPLSAPQSPWWNSAYQVKRNLLVLNNDTDPMPARYPVLLHFDSTTSPTAAEVYAISRSATLGDDLRIVYNNQAELNRAIYNFSPSSIDVWFPLQTEIAGNQSDAVSYQLYIGNAAAASPPADTNSVFAPEVDANTIGLWHFQEGAGEGVYDSSGRGHNGNFVNAGWDVGPLGRSGVFNGVNSTVELGSNWDFDSLNAFTLEAWVRPARPGWGMVFNKGINGYGQYGMRITGDTGVECTVGADGGDRSVPSSSRIPVGVWSHIACVHDGGSGFRVYINGRQEGERTDSRPALTRNYPLYFGNAPYWGGMAFDGQIQHVRISSIARYDFPYARIDALPSVAAGDILAPPVQGQSDLIVSSVTAFHDAGGQQTVQVVVRNQGNLPTYNGFHTDLYMDNKPAGPGDYAGSVQFWVNSPIASGATVTLTAALPQVTPQAAIESAVDGTVEVEAAPSEVTRVLYVQADSSGVLRDADRSNNTTDGFAICTVARDSYEPDGTAAKAKALNLDRAQTHNFSVAADQDWLRFNATAGRTYVLNTDILGAAADTYLEVYSQDGSALLASNDDFNNSLASSITWTAPASGDYYLRVRHWNPSVQGCGTQYKVRVTLLPEALADLVVTGMGITDTANNGCLANPSTLQLLVRVLNQGTVGASSFVVNVNGQRRSVAGLAAGADTWVAFDQSGMGQYTAVVDVDNQVVETDETNNQLVQQVPIPTPLPPCANATATATNTPTPRSPVTATSTATPTPPSSSTPIPTFTATATPTAILGSPEPGLYLPTIRR